MSSSAINTQVAQLKIGNVQNQADNSAVYSGGIWSLKNSTALTSVTITDAGDLRVRGSLIVNSGALEVGINRTSDGPAYVDFSTTTTTVDNNARIIRNAGATATLDIQNNDFITLQATGSWGSFNYSRSLLIRGTSSNPAITMVAADGTLPVSIVNENGNLVLATMPELSNPTATPSVKWRMNRNGNFEQLSGSGIVYQSMGGGNAIAFKWASPNVVARIDNAVDITLANVSDYRIKRNIDTMQTPALERMAQLRPVTYQMADYGTLFKASEEIKEGFIAHELQAVIPSAVEGEKDAEDQIQSLKLDALCSVMVKAIQELSAKNDALEARLAALEAKP